MPQFVSLVLASCCTAAVTAPPPSLRLTKDGQAACRIVLMTPSPSDRLAEMAVRAIADPVKRWGGVELPVLRLGREASKEQAGQALASPAIVLATLDELRRVEPDIVLGTPALLRLESLDEHAYVRVPMTRDGVRLLVVAGRTPRGLYNGAVHLGECNIDGPAGELTADASEVVRSPHLRQRPVYVLTIWAEEDEYSTDDWMKVFEAFARDGITHVYFWLSGHYPSKAFPQTCKLADKDWDSTVDSRIATLDDQRRLIQRSHELGMRFYIGGALGAWCGTFMLTHREPGTMREGSSDESGQDVSAWSLCPSSERARNALVAYYKEMFDSLPEADGLYIESADEYGECACARCRVPVDSLGSRMFGQNQLSLVQRIMHEIWRDHPNARLAYTIGYTPHKQDPAYYEVVRQMSSDPRIEWMEARRSWTFPGPDGKARPPVFFSPRILNWEYFDTRPLNTLIENSWQAAESGLAGCIATFSPGFASGSFYHEIPYPTHQLPYVMTHFVFREATWSPTASVEEMKRRVGQRFFGAQATSESIEQLWSLRDLMLATAGRKIRPEQLEKLARIEAAVATARGAASPKMRDGLDLMTRAAGDIRQRCEVASSRPR